MSDKKPTVKKPAVVLKGADPKARALLRNSDIKLTASLKGIDGDILTEPVPKFIDAPSEKVLKNANNSWVVLGRDRPGPRSSGYGGKGDTHAASIDLVTGRMAHKAKSVDAKTGEILNADPDFKIDAARIYISQKTDVDKNFELTPGKVGTSKARSAIAMKADGIRLIAREGIKLITSEATKNSQGGDLQSYVGIDIIAGNVNDPKTGTDLQPMAKGKNLSEALQRLTFHVEKLNGIVDSFLMSQMEFNDAVTDHWHPSPFFIEPTAPSLPVQMSGMMTQVNLLTKVKQSLVTHKANLGSFKRTYLKQSGKKYINSRFNNVN
jgi:hypothetical protein